MSIRKYQVGGEVFWRLDMIVTLPDGKVQRKKKGKIRTKEEAKALEAKWRSESFERKWFDREADLGFLVKGAWDLYAKGSEHDSSASDASRAAHLVRLLGKQPAATLSEADVDHYRAVRFKEPSKRTGRVPSSATLDREVELLKRTLAYAVRSRRLRMNPLAGVALLNRPNTRDQVVDEAALQAGLAKLAKSKRSAWMVPALLTSYDTGMRIGEVMALRRTQVDWKTGRIALQAEATKTEEPRIIILSKRALEALKAVPASLRTTLIFYHPKTCEPRGLPRRAFHAAFGKEVRVHDLRRSFATLARRRGKLPESVIMKMGGWLTPSVFRRYNIVDEDDLVEAQKRLEAARTRPKSVPVAKGAGTGSGNPQEKQRSRPESNGEPLGSKPLNGKGEGPAQE